MKKQSGRPAARGVSRRAFLSRTCAAGALGAAATAQAASAREQTPPNVLYIICDQMRGDALSCLGNPNARTPHLDQLAREGVLFERWFSNNPVCAPSRVTNFTGRYPHEHGMVTNGATEPPRRFEDTLLGHFRDRGYRAGWVGKNHTYAKPLLYTLDYCRLRSREPFRNYSPYVPPWWHSDMYWPEEECCAAQNTEDAIAFLRQSKPGEPFFLHVSYFDPHPPYFAPATFTSRYAAKDMTIPPYVPPENLSERLALQHRACYYHEMTDADLKETLRYYYASIEWGVDYQVGRLMKALDELGLRDNTVVVFTSDHGDFMGHHHMVRKGIYLYDDLLHVPMIVRGPEGFARNHRVKALAQGVDFFPTLAEATGGAAPKGLPGRPLTRFLEGESGANDDACVFASSAYSDPPEDYFDHPEPRFDPDSETPLHTRIINLLWNPEQRTAMARTRDWKLILNETRPPELFHMDGGITERKNVAGDTKYAAIQRELETRIRDAWTW